MSNVNYTYQYDKPPLPSAWQSDTERRFYTKLMDVLDDIYLKYGRMDEKLLAPQVVQRIENTEEGVETLDTTINGDGGIADQVVSIDTTVSGTGGLVSRVTAAEGNIVTLDGDLNNEGGIKDRVATAEGNITTVTTTANGVKTEVENARGDFASLGLCVGNITQRVGTAEGNITTVTTTANGTATEVANARGSYSTLKQNVDAIVGRIGTAEGNITTVTATANGVATEVANARGSFSSLKQNVDSITQRVGTAEGNITTVTTTANGLDATINGANGLVTQMAAVPGQIELAVGNIAIGGTNLFPQSKASGAVVGASYYHEDYAVTTGLYPQAGWLISLPQSSSQVEFRSADFLDKDKIVVGDEYTLSFSCASGGETTLHCDLYPDDIVGDFGAKEVTVTQAPRRVVITGTLTLDEGVSSLSEIYLRFWRRTSSANYHIVVWDIKLEKGNKVTAWSPAPEDAEAKITINREGISTLVTKTGVNNLTGSDTLYSKITQTASSITAAVNAVEVGGTNLFPRSAAINAITNPSYYHKGEAISGSLKPQSNWNITLPQSSSQVLFRSADFYDPASIKLDSEYTLSFSYIGFIPSGQSGALFYCDLYPDTIASPFSQITLTADGNSRRAVVTGTLAASSALSEVELRFWRPTTSTNAQIKIWDIKLETGNKATAWSPHPDDPADALESGSTVVINKDEVAISTPTFSVNVSGGAGDTTFDQEGMTVPIVNSPSVAPRYTGPTSISVDASSAALADGSRFRTLTDALNALSNKWVDRNVTITLATNTTEPGVASLAGIGGSGVITIDLNSKTVNGRLGFYYVTQPIEVKSGTISCTGDVSRIFFNGCTRAYIHDLSLVGSTTSEGAGVQASFSAVYAGAISPYDLKYGFDSTNLSNIFVSNATGNVAAAFHITGASHIGLYGTVPTYTTGVSKDASSTFDGTLPGSGSGGTTPSAPTATATVTASSVATKTYQPDVGWGTDVTLRQGTYGGIDNLGVISFGTTGWSGKTIVSGELTLRRLNGGKGSSVTVKMKTTTSTAASGQAAPNTTTTDYGVIGTVNINNTLACSIPAAALQEIANGTRKSLMLYADGTADYAVFAGSDNSTYKPSLTVTYEE